MQMKRRVSLRVPGLLVLLAVLLAGCVQDTASYMIGNDRNHAITLARAQQWFWDDRVEVGVIAARQPACLGGINLKKVPRGAALALYRAPDEYPEPIFILDVEKASYAVSTLSCKVQKFPTPPDDKGQRLGVFKEVDGRLRYVAGK
jgi:hypothetical protein